jgi:serine/threonine protein kinase
VEIGETVGNFEVISQLGKGGMGSVYLALQKNVKTKVAIKVLHTDISTNTTHVQRFFNEAVAVSQIHHSGIVKIFDVGFHTSGEAYLVMEYLEGQTLSQRIRNRTRLGIGMVADFGRQIASVLDATHEAGITHRDLKPDNIYLVRDNELVNGERVKILDFGIAKLVPDSAPGAPRMTALGLSSIGTPNYMSPEQWHSLAEADWRTDAYALGCVAFEMACGRPPFIGESMADVCAQHLGEPPPVPSKLVPGLPRELDQLIGRLLEKEPAARPTLREAMQIFTELGHSEGIALSSIPPKANLVSPLAPQPAAGASTELLAANQSQSFTPTAQVAPSKKPRRLGLVIAIAALAIGGTVAAAVVMSSSRTAKPEPTAKPAAAPDAGLAKPDATVVVAALPDAAAAVVVEPDAAVVEPPPPSDDGFKRVTRAPLRTRQSKIVVDRAMTVEVCIDETGQIMKVLPESLDPSMRRQITVLWRYAPYRERPQDASVAVCFPVALQPAKVAVAAPQPPAAGSGSGSAKPTRDADPPPPPQLAESLDAKAIEARLTGLRPAIEQCGKGTVDGTYFVKVVVAAKGYVESARLVKAEPMAGFAACVELKVKLANYPPTLKGGTTTTSFKFRKAREPGNSGDTDNDGY